MNTTNIPLSYGHQEISVEIPRANLLGIFYPEVTKQIINEDRLLQEAMKKPVGTKLLREIVHPGQKVAIVTSDLTRPTPSDHMLPFIIKELEAADIPDKDVTIILALGLHRPLTENEIDVALSIPIHKRFPVENHDPGNTVHLGWTSRGTPVELFRPLVEADVRICLGNIEFHYFAGYSGGAKAILPGCASRECITANHSWMTYPLAAAGRIYDNPVRLDLEEGVAMLGVDFLLNVVVDGEHNIVGAFAGDVCKAHRLGCKMVYLRGTVDIPCLGDIVVASAGGYPKDINFYQAHKALENARHFVRQGGIIILVAECIEGFGNNTMESWMLELSTPDEALQKIQHEFVLGGHKAAAIASIEKQATIYLISSLPVPTVKRIRFTPFSTVQEAFASALSKLGKQSQVVVLPQANSILPCLKKDLALNDF